ncbi:MAG: GAF domain-containing protein [Anaerolineales bacterium]|nr:GAF domain-containing protein [Anaerolineales bacterium]
MITVLLIDSNRELVQSFSQKFHSDGYETLAVSAYEDLAAVVAKWGDKVDIILLDPLMPDISGEELFIYLRQQPQLEGVPIIIFSEMLGVTQWLTIIHEGADDYIVKPSTPDELSARIATQVQLKQLRAEKKIVEQYLARQEHYLQAISQIGLLATQHMDVEQMVETVTSAIVNKFAGSHCCCFYLAVPGQERLRFVGAFPKMCVPLDNVNKLFIEAQRLKRTIVTRSRIIVPIMHDDDLMGLMAIQGDSSELMEEIVPALSTLAVHLATVIANINLFADVQIRNRELENLVLENQRLLLREQEQRKQTESVYQMSQIISGSLQEDEVMDAVMDTIRALFDVETASIRLLSGESQLVYASVLEEDAVVKSVIDQSSQLGVVDYVVETKKPLILNHVASHPRFRQAVDAPATSMPKTMLCLPLVARDIPVGAIQLINKQQGMFNQRDLTLLNAIAPSVAIAIKNSQFYQHQVNLAEQLKQSQEQLVQSEKMAATGRLAASLAHEINNPLQAIHSCLQLTMDFDLPKPKQTEYLDMAREEVERLSDLVIRILDFSRPAKSEKAALQVNDLVRQVLRLTQKHISHYNWEIQTQLTTGLAPVYGISDQISQVFLSIILNAFDAITGNGVVRILTKQDGKWVKVIISDNGQGMTPEVINHIYEPFYTTKAGRSGLGLTLSYHIINQHGGKIEVKSRVGAGSAFAVFLPVHVQ